MIVPIGGVHRAVVEALRVRATRSPTTSGPSTWTSTAAHDRAVRRDWATWGGRVQLVVLRVAVPVADGAAARVHRAGRARPPDDYVTVVLPEFVPAHWWHHLLHNQRALLIKGALLFRPNVVVTSVPFHLSK